MDNFIIEVGMEQTIIDFLQENHLASGENAILYIARMNNDRKRKIYNMIKRDKHIVFASSGSIAS